MQAHKGLSKMMKSAWECHPKSWWERMKSSPLGIVGAIIGIITVIPAIAVAIYSAFDNKKRKAVIAEENNQFKLDYDKTQNSIHNSNSNTMHNVLLSKKATGALHSEDSLNTEAVTPLKQSPQNTTLLKSPPIVPITTTTESEPTHNTYQ